MTEHVFTTIILGIISGIPASYVFLLFTRKRIVPLFYIRPVYRLNCQHIDERKITAVAFWNEGRDAIRRSDINPKNPIKIYCIETDGCPTNYYSALIPHNNETDFPNNGFELKEKFENGYKCYILSFVELKRKEGIIIEITHRVDSEVVFQGSIIGCGCIKKESIKYANFYYDFLLYSSPVMLLFSVGALIFYPGIMLYGSLEDSSAIKQVIREPLAFLMIFISAGFSAFMFSMAFNWFWGKFLRHLPPNIVEYFSKAKVL
jgi:hypothetical protein